MKYRIFNPKNSPLESVLQEKLSACKAIDDIIFVLGGDGSLLNAIHEFGIKYHYILINTGHLGFFSDFSKDDIDVLIQKLNDKELESNSFNLIKGIINNKEYYAFNDVTLSLFSKSFSANIIIDQVPLETYRGTGLVISTPQGSTGYTKSINGAIIDWTMPCMELTPLAPIVNNTYHSFSSPLVISKDKEITVINQKKQKWMVAFDNQIIDATIDQLTLSISSDKINVYFKKGSNQIGRLSKHLMVKHD